MSEPIFWLSRDEVRELDRRAIEGFGVPGLVLMENAGRGAAELLMRLNPEKRPVVILCGPGNNGGDGFVMARHLDNHKYEVHVIYVADRVPTRGDAAPNYTAAIRAGLLIGRAEDELSPNGSAFELVLGRKWNGWIVDALFGTGLTRPLSTPYSELTAEINASGKPVLAVDIPSGLDCDTGEPLGPTVRAAHTATFVAHKKGFLDPKSREWTGEVHVIDIGAPRKLVEEYKQRRASGGV